MDRRFENVEMDSTIEYNPGQRNASDPEIEFRTQVRGTDAGQLLAGSMDTETVGPRTDADACQASDPNVGHWPVGFTPRGDPASMPPSAAAEASAAWRGQTHLMLYPTTEAAYYGPHPSASGAVVVDQSSAMGSGSGCFVGPSSSQPEVARVAVSTWGDFTPTTTGARTNTTATLTSMYMTCSTVGGPVQAVYIRGPPPTGLTSVRPARQVFMPQPIEPSGRFPGVLAGPVGILRPPVGTVERTWGDASTRSNLRPEFDSSKVASRPRDRAVNPSGERYLSNGLVSNSVSVTRAEIYSQGNHGARPNATVESQQMCPAGMEAGSTGVRLVSGAPGQSSGPMGVSSHLPPPCLPAGMHVIQPAGMDVQSMCASAQSPVTQGDQVVGHKWVHTPSTVSGLSSTYS